MLKITHIIVLIFDDFTVGIFPPPTYIVMAGMCPGVKSDSSPDMEFVAAFPLPQSQRVCYVGSV